MNFLFSILKIRTILSVGFLYLNLFAFTQTTIPFTTPGTTTWTVPACVTSITVQVWGGGGGGGGSASNQNQGGDEACSQGGGGGGGGFVSRVYAVTPGEVYTIVVGAGGTAGSGGSTSAAANNGGNGGNSSFSGPATIAPGTLTAFGGNGGGGAWSRNTSNGFTSHVGSDGAGGNGSGGINGTTTFTGGNGSSGRHSGSCNDVSGAGGGGAGTTGNGGNASATNNCNLRTGGTGGAIGGGPGADGRRLVSLVAGRERTTGNNGIVIGSGGGGAMVHLNDWPNTWSTAIGGTGARGEVRIIYTSGAPNQPSVITGLTPIPCGGYTGTYSVVNDPTVTSYTWTFSGTGTITGTGNSITLNASSAGTLTVIPTGACDGPPQTFNITLESIPNPPTSITGTTTICPGNSTTLTAVGGSVGATGVTTQWFTGSCGGTPAGTGTTLTVSPTSTTTYYVQTSNACGQSVCAQQIVSTQVVVGGTATIANTTFCGTTSTNLTVTGQTATANIQWQQSTDGGVTWTNISGATTTPYTVNGITTTTSFRAVISATGCTTSANSTVVTITSTPNLTPSVAITGAPTSAICAGSSVTFTANPTNGGTTPTYQWQINGVNVPGATGNTFTSTSLANNDIVTVIMTSNDPCAATPTATSAGSTITVGGTVTPSVAITGAPTSAICVGSSVTFTANPTNGGTTPTYQWQINGVNVPGATGTTFTSTTLANNDIVTVVMTSNDPCATTPTAASTGATITVGGTVTPSVAITGAPTSAICAGSSVTFTANPTNGGTTPTYQWQINGVNVPGATGTTFTSTTLANNDIVTVVMTSNDPCAATPTATSAGSTITVGGTVTPSVAITGAPTSAICAGSSVTFTANPTNGGTTPTYQWQINGVNVPGATGTTFTSTTLANNDIVTVIMTSNDPCAATPTATSAGSTITVGGTVTPSVAITGAPTSAICVGSSVTFTANPTNGGTTPTYQWQINGVNVPGATGTTFTSTTLANNDIVTVIMTSNDPCASTPTATSAGSTMNVSSTINATISSTPIPCGASNTGTATVVATGGTAPYTFNWSPTGGTAATATGLAAGNYIVTITDAAGCSRTVSTTVTGSPGLTLSTSSTPVDCGSKNGTATATATGGSGNITYVWNPGNLSGQTISNLSVGNYTVTATDGTGCSATTSVYVAQNGNLNLQANPYSAVVEEGNSVNLNASFSPYIPGTTYNWTPPNGLSCTDCPNPTATPTETTTYNVQITTPDGCTADTNITLTFKLKCGEFFVPTIFSPNGDGNNDEFKLYGKCVAGMKMKIYDRWGELVFESDDQSFGWDGTYKGQMMNSASFVYVIDVSFIDERFEHIKGNVSLVR